MKRIESQAELEHLHSVGEGLIYNDFSRKGPSGKKYNILHAAYCRWMLRSNVNVPKYFLGLTLGVINVSLNKKSGWAVSQNIAGSYARLTKHLQKNT